MNTPNKLTLFRVVMIPFFVVFMLAPIGGAAAKWIALAIFIIASLTDALDGYLARRDNLITDFGKFMDPLADKLLVCSALICLVELDKIPCWVVIIIIARAADNGVVIAASYWGKFKTVSQMVMIILLIADLGGVFYTIGQIFIYLSMALTVISLIDYLIKNRNVISLQK